MNRKIFNFFTFLLILTSSVAFSQQKNIEPIPFGDMNQWMERVVDESFIIGGKKHTLYEIATPRIVEENTPYVPQESKWATSSVYARVSGVNKSSSTVFPEKRGEGDYCARLETRVEKVKVLGLINISVVATGSIFLGVINEPITDTKDPQAKLNTGIPFTRRPKELIFDYKVDPASERIYDNGFSRRKNLEGQNATEAVLLLQQRWEDNEGNIYAKRVGTAWQRFTTIENEWQNNHSIEVLYGDITSSPKFEPFMNLLTHEPLYCLNSKGEIKMINEIDWAPKETQPTHIVVRFSSGFGGAYIGSIGSKFWIDNVALGY